ncbi:hypothetical protein T484DRAFT_1769284, partial [Baffinella frigidus]
VVTAAGLNATFLPTSRTLPATGVPDAALLDKSSQVSGAGEPQYWGVMFDVFANRSINVTAVDLNSFSAGVVEAWVYARKCAGGAVACGMEGFEESIAAWVLVGHANLTVEASLRAKVPLAVEAEVSAGVTRAFLVVGSGGVRFADEASGRVVTDEFMILRAGVLVKTTIPNGGTHPNSFSSKLGSAEIPFYYDGNIYYRNHEVVGDTYRCRFNNTYDGSYAESKPTRAFSRNVSQLAGHNAVICEIPVWEFPEIGTELTLVTDSSRVAHTNTSGSIFSMHGYWTGMLGPTQGLGGGGTILTIVGKALSDVGGTMYACVLNYTHAICSTPEWKGSYGTTNLDIVRIAGNMQGTTMAFIPTLTWLSESSYTVGTAGSTECNGTECRDGTDVGPACLGYPCVYTPPSAVSAGYAGRRFAFTEMVDMGITPSEGPATGGTTVTVLGYGLEQNREYKCVFGRHGSAGGLSLNGGSGAGEALSVDARVEGENVVCDTPTGGGSWLERFRELDVVEADAAFWTAYQDTTLAGAFGVGDAELSVYGLELFPDAVIARVGAEFLALGAPWGAGEGEVAFEVVARGLFGTAEEDHVAGEVVHFMAWSDAYTPGGGASWDYGLAGFLGSALTDTDTFADVVGAVQLPPFGIARSGEEFVLYQAMGPSTVMLLQRGLFGSVVSAHDQFSPVFPVEEQAAWKNMFFARVAEGALLGELGLQPHGTVAVDAARLPEGTFVALIGREFLSFAVNVSGDDTSLNVVGRGLFGSEAAPHAAGARVGFLAWNDVTRWASWSVYKKVFRDLQVDNDALNNAVLFSTAILLADVAEFEILEVTIDTPPPLDVSVVQIGDEFLGFHTAFEAASGEFTLALTARGLFGSAVASHTSSDTVHFWKVVPTEEGAGAAHKTLFGFKYSFVRSFSTSSITYAKGGASLNITGVFYHPGTGYTCKFAKGEYTATSAATVLSPSLATCAMPYSTHSHGDIELFLTSSRGDMFWEDRVYGVRAYAVFPVEQGWDGFAASQAAAVTLMALHAYERDAVADAGRNAGGAAGGTVLEFAVFGFVANASDYVCVFTRGNASMETGLTAGSTVDASCATPVWGSVFPAAGGRVAVSVMQGGVVLDYTAGGLAAVTCGNETACNFLFIQVWNGTSGVSPGNGSASGGSMVTIEGFGFDPAAEYYCNFTASNGEWAVSLPVHPTSVTELTCTTPLWPYTEAVTRISMYQKIEPVPPYGMEIAPNASCNGTSNATGNQTCQQDAIARPLSMGTWIAGPVMEVEFEFYTVWQSKSRAVGVAKGGHEIVLFGTGLDDSSMGYRCLFTGSDTDGGVVMVESDMAYPSPDHRSVMCIAPFWDYPAQVASISLTAASGERTIVYFDEMMIVDNTPFEYTQGWDKISEHTGVASGGTVLELTAYGLTKMSSDYVCVFTRGNETLQTMATVTSSVDASCETPVWGSVFPAAGGRVVVSVMQGDVFLNYTAGGLEAMTCGNETACNFLFTQVWNGTSDVSPGNGSASGGSMVTVEGFGFDPAAEYYCNFTALNGEWAVSLPVHPTSVTELTCTTPFWNFVDATTSISLHGPDGGAIPTFTPAAFHFIHRWFSSDSDSAPAKGGKLFTISGDGFHSQAAYRCEFSSRLVDVSVESPARFLSASKVECAMPAWNHSAGPVLLSIFDLTSTSHLLHVDPQGAHGATQDILILPGWDAITADTRDGSLEVPASGGTVVSVAAYGLNSSLSYRCVFAADGALSLITRGVVLAHDRLECATVSGTGGAWGDVRDSDVSATLLIFAGAKAAFEGDMEMAEGVAELAFTAGTVSDNFSCKVDKRESCAVFFFQYLLSSTTLPIWIPAEGAAVTFAGYGFNPSTPYACRWAGQDATSPAKVISLTEVTCSVPRWVGYVYANASLRLAVPSGDVRDYSRPEKTFLVFAG